MPDVGDDDVYSDVAFIFVSSEAPAMGVAPAMTGVAASVSALAKQQVVMRNAL